MITKLVKAGVQTDNKPRKIKKLRIVSSSVFYFRWTIFSLGALFLAQIVSVNSLSCPHTYGLPDAQHTGLQWFPEQSVRYTHLKPFMHIFFCTLVCAEHFPNVLACNYFLAHNPYWFSFPQIITRLKIQKCYNSSYC